MNNTTISLEDELLPLTEDKYGQYFNASLGYYEKDPSFRNLSDLEKAKIMAEFCSNQSATLTFNQVQLFRVITTWLLFFISAVGNSFVLFCVFRRSRTSHVHMIMLHFAIADLAFTFLVIPEDALWNTTMQWFGGDLLCKVCQMGKHIGMYISSFMVVVMALDRCCGILQPMCTIAKQRRRTKYLVGGAWILSILSAIPAAVLFGVKTLPFCPSSPPFVQCMDTAMVQQDSLKPYYFFTMAMSFLVPMILCTLFYSLVICEISNMMQRDRAMMGRRDSAISITRARKKTLKMTALVTLTFLVFWGPYYAYGIYFWFTRKALAIEISTVLFLLMYVHPAVHPFIYGILVKDVRDTFSTLMLHLKKFITCSRSDIDEIRRRRLNSRYSTDNSATTATFFRASSDYRLVQHSGAARSSSDTSPQNPELMLLRHKEDSTLLGCGDASVTCLQSENNGQLCRTNGYSRSVDQAQSRTRVVDGIKPNMKIAKARKDDNCERDRLISMNSEHCSGASEDTLSPLTKAQTNNNGNGCKKDTKTTRTSQVSFKLPDLSGSEENSTGADNNNKEVKDGRGDNISKSTGV